jgi:hypothetical protein
VVVVVVAKPEPVVVPVVKVVVDVVVIMRVLRKV